MLRDLEEDKNRLVKEEEARKAKELAELNKKKAEEAKAAAEKAAADKAAKEKEKPKKKK